MSGTLIGPQPTGEIEGAEVSAVAYNGFAVSIHGKPGRVALLDDEGNVYASGTEVARELRAVAVNSYRNFLESKGWLRVYAPPIPPDAKT